ncbi:MAG: hypothetical protein ACTSSK_00745 [Candidatus Heimdallarchaeota archaeon]
MIELSAISPNSKEITELFVEMDDGVKIRIVKFQPKKDLLKPVIFFIPGFLSIIKHWTILIDNLVKNNYTIYLMETREKQSSTATKKSKFNSKRYLNDLEQSLYEVKVKDNFIIMGSSLGAGMIIKYLSTQQKNGTPYPDKGILLEAIYNTNSIKKAIAIAKLPKRVFSIVKNISAKIVPAILKQFKLYPSKYKSLIESINYADSSIMRICLINAKDENLKDYLKEILIPIFVVGADKDNIHDKNQSRIISEEVHNGSFDSIDFNNTISLEELAKRISIFIENN